MKLKLGSSVYQVDTILYNFMCLQKHTELVVVDLGLLWMTATRVTHGFVGGSAIIFLCVCVRDRGRMVSTVAAVEEIIPGLDLSLSNRNSYNYCGSIRLKRQKNLHRERKGGNAHHPQKCNSTMLARLWKQRQSSVRHNAAVVSSLYGLKNCQPSKYFISAFPRGLPFFLFESHQIEP